MTAQKVKIPQNILQYKYDKIADILDVYIGEPELAFSEEIDNGVFCYYSRVTDELIGVSVMDYTLRDITYLNKILPFSISYDVQ